MKILTSQGQQKILDFLENAKKIQYAETWFLDAENQFFNNRQCVLELKANQTENGFIQTLILLKEDFE